MQAPSLQTPRRLTAGQLGHACMLQVRVKPDSLPYDQGEAKNKGPRGKLARLPDPLWRWGIG